MKTSRVKDTALPRLYPDLRRHVGPVGHTNHDLCSGPVGFVPERRAFLVSCPTLGCSAVGSVVAIEADVNADGIVRILCGSCSEWIENPIDLGVVPSPV